MREEKRAFFFCVVEQKRQHSRKRENAIDFQKSVNIIDVTKET